MQFERAGAQYINLTTPPYEFDVRGVGRAKLGPRELRVTIKRDGRTERTTSLFVSVRLIKPVVVARGPLNVGMFVRPDDLALEERSFDDLAEVGIDALAQATGQQVKDYVAPGEMLNTDDLTMVDLVKRSRPVTLVGGSAGVSAQLSGYALDSGGLGDHVRVRLGNLRQDRRVVRGVVNGLGTVRLLDQ